MTSYTELGLPVLQGDLFSLCSPRKVAVSHLKAIWKAGGLHFTVISIALQRESFGLVGGMALKCEWN